MGPSDRRERSGQVSATPDAANNVIAFLRSHRIKGGLNSHPEAQALWENALHAAAEAFLDTKDDQERQLLNSEIRIALNDLGLREGTFFYNLVPVLASEAIKR